MSIRKLDRKEVAQRNQNQKNLARRLRMEHLENRIVFAGVSPIAVNDLYHAVVDEPMEVASSGVLANDTDADADLLSAVSFKGPSHGTLNLNSDGSFAYSPDPGFTGFDSFIYQADDGTSRSKLAAVTIHVTSDNGAPQAENDTYSTAEDGILDIGSTHGLLSNDIDPEGDSLSATLVSGPEHGTLTLDSDGSFVYQPNADFNGSDAFVYSVSDGEFSDEGVVELIVASANDVPTAFNDEYAIGEDSELVVSGPGVLANDVDVDAETVLTAVLTAGPDHGSLTLNDDGSFTYTPNADFNGTDAFMYQASDGTSFSSVVVVEISVDSDNDIPAAANDIYATEEDVELVVAGPGVLGNDTDSDAGSVLTAVLADGPEHGSLTLNEDGSFTYAPDENFNGTDAFTYQAFDGTDFSDIVVVEITVHAVNDAPNAANDLYTTDEDTDLIVNGPGVLENDADVDAEAMLTAMLTDGPTHGTLTLNDDGSFTYSPEANFSGTDAFTYQANDGELLSEIVVVEITVNAVSDPPIAANDAYATPEDTELIIGGPGVLANDTDADPDTILTAVLSVGPSNGSLTLNEDGSFTYAPNANFNGTDAFTYRAFDGTNFSEEVVVELSVSSINDAPVALDDEYVTMENVELNIPGPGVLGNDSDLDSETILSATISTDPAHGTLSLGADGGFVYTPDEDFVGTDSFSYMASDGELSVAAVVSIIVQETNDAPLSVNESYTVTSDSTLEVDSLLGVLANDSDPNGDPMEVILFRGPDNGVLALNPDGSFAYTPNPGFVGMDAFIYRVTDGSLDSSLAVVTLHVVAPPAESELTLPVDDSSSQAVDAAIDDLTGMSTNEPLQGNDLDTEFAVCNWSALVPSIS